MGAYLFYNPLCLINYVDLYVVGHVHQEDPDRRDRVQGATIGAVVLILEIVVKESWKNKFISF